MKLLHLLLAVVVVQSFAMALVFFEPSAVRAADEKKDANAGKPSPTQTLQTSTGGQGVENFAAITVRQSDGSDALVVFGKTKNALEKKDTDKPFEQITSMAVYAIDTKSTKQTLSLLATRYIDYDLVNPGYSHAGGDAAKTAVETAKKSYHDLWDLNQQKR